MSRSACIAAAVGTVALVSSVGVLGAQETQEYKAPGASKTELIHQKGLAAGEALEARAIRFELPPGYQGGRHHHPGDLIVYVESGSLTVELDDGTHIYSAGQAFYETPGQVMRGSNESTSESTVLVVFQVGTQGEPLMVKAE